MAYTHNLEVLALNPVTFLRLGEAAGSNAVDSSGNGHNGTLNSAVLGTVSSLVGDGDTAITFQNVTSPPPLSLAASGSYSLGFASNSRWSLEFLHRSNSETNAYPMLVGSGNGTTTASWLLYHYVALNQFIFKFNTGEYGSAASILNDSTWRHIVVTWNGTSLSFYINGAVTSSAPAQTAATGVNGLTFADGVVGSPSKASLDEFAVYGFALSSAQVGVLYGSLGNKFKSIAGAAAGAGTAVGTLRAPSNPSTSLSPMSDTLIVDGVDISTCTGIVVEDWAHLMAPGRRRGSNDVIPGRRGQLGAEKVYDAYAFSVPITVLAEDSNHAIPATAALRRAQMLANLRALAATLSNTNGLVTLVRRLTNGSGGYDVAVAAGEFVDGLQLALYNSESGRTELQFVNLDGAWNNGAGWQVP